MTEHSKLYEIVKKDKIYSILELTTRYKKDELETKSLRELVNILDHEFTKSLHNTE